MTRRCGVRIPSGRVCVCGDLTDVCNVAFLLLSLFLSLFVA